MRAWAPASCASPSRSCDVTYQAIDQRVLLNIWDGTAMMHPRQLFLSPSCPCSWVWPGHCYMSPRRQTKPLLVMLCESLAGYCLSRGSAHEA